MRLINHRLKEEVEEHMPFHLNFDQSNPATLKRLLNLRIKSCHIGHFNSKRLFMRNSKIFIHPKRLRKLIFDGAISRTNLMKILNQSCSVEQLIFTHQTLGVQGLIIPAAFDRCLQRLKAVTHLNLQLLRYPQGDPFEAEENIDAFFRAVFPNLESFRLYFSLWGNFSSLLKFLDRHRSTLKELELQVGDRGDSINTENYLRVSPTLVNESLRKNLLTLNLSKFRFRDDVLNLNASAKDLIMSILMSQKRLQVLEFCSPGELSWNMLKSVIITNEQFLTEVVVYSLQTTLNGANNANRRERLNDNIEPLEVPEVVLDMSVFSRCSHLKTLALSCASSNGNDPQVVGTVVMKMINLQSISNCIERLHLTGFTLDGQDLIHLASKEGNNLKEVLIADAGSMRYSYVLNSFLKRCRRLKYLNVRPVVLQAANDELWWREIEMLSELYERFMGITYDPIDDLEGFEANIKESDREWLSTHSQPVNVYGNGPLQ